MAGVVGVYIYLFIYNRDSFNVYQEIVDERLVEVGTKNQLVDVLALKYSLDAMNEALLARTCTNQGPQPATTTTTITITITNHPPL